MYQISKESSVGLGSRGNVSHKTRGRPESHNDSNESSLGGQGIHDGKQSTLEDSKASAKSCRICTKRLKGLDQKSEGSSLEQEAMLKSNAKTIVLLKRTAAIPGDSEGPRPSENSQVYIRKEENNKASPGKSAACNLPLLFSF